MKLISIVDSRPRRVRFRPKRSHPHPDIRQSVLGAACCVWNRQVFVAERRTMNAARFALFVTEGLYRVHMGGTISRINAEDNADHPAYSECQDKRSARNDRGHLAETRD